MDIKVNIERFRTRSLKIQSLRNDLKAVFDNEKELWLKFESLNPDEICDDQIMSLLGDALQLVDSSERIERFELNDIKRIYELLVEFHPEVIQYQIDLVNFCVNVMDDKSSALSMINDSIKKIDIKRSELLALIEEISN